MRIIIVHIFEFMKFFYTFYFRISFFLDLYSGYVHHERKACSGDIIPDFEKNPYFITASSMHS